MVYIHVVFCYDFLIDLTWSTLPKETPHDDYDSRGLSLGALDNHSVYLSSRMQEVAPRGGYTVYASGKGGSRKMEINEMVFTQGGSCEPSELIQAKDLNCSPWPYLSWHFPTGYFKQAVATRPLIRLIHCSCVMVTMVAPAVSLARLNGVTSAQPQRAADAIQRGSPIFIDPEISPSATFQITNVVGYD